MTTATSRIQRTVQSYRQRLMQREKQAVAALERYHQHTLAVIQPKLNKLYNDILKKQETLGEGETISRFWITERIRLEGLQLLISSQIDQFGAMALQSTRMLQHTGVSLGLESAQQQLRDVIPSQVKAVFGTPSTKALDNLVGATQKGSPLEELFSGYGQEAAQKATKALVSGVTLGDNPRTIAPRVQQALGISRNRALVTVRNEALRCYKSAALETYRENGDVLDGWIWSADLFGDRTCLACILMNGTEHPLSEDMASHTLCRCAQVPKTKGYADILSNLGIDASSIEESRVSLPSGEEWFLQQSEERQQAAFNSNSAYELYKSGKVQLQDFIGYNDSADWGRSVKVRSVKDLLK